MAEDVVTLLKIYKKQVKIEISNEIEMLVSKKVFLENPVGEGDIIDKSQYLQSLEKSLKKEALHKAVSYIAMRSRTCLEISEKLKEKGYSDEVISAVVNRLKKEGLLDDKSFAENWVRYRLSCNIGRFKIEHELATKGISGSIIENALDACNYEAEALVQAQNFAQKYIKRYADVDELIAKHKTMQALMRKGFSYDVAKTAVERLIN